MTDGTVDGDRTEAKEESPATSASPQRFNQNDFKRLRNVRLQLFEGAMRGAVVGTTLGAVGYFVVKKLNLFPLPKRFGLAVSATGSACVCAYIGAVVYGKNAMAEVGDVIRKADRRNLSEEVLQGRMSSYQAELLRQEREVLENLESSFERRAEAIRQHKASQGKQSE